MVDAQQVQHGGVEVVPGRPGSRPPSSRPRRSRRRRCRASAPAPASQTLKPYWLWSRPVPTTSAADWVNGVRPNSVVNSTSVSSSMPRCCRSRSRPATGRSMRRGLAGRGSRGTFSWPSQFDRGLPTIEPPREELDEPHAPLEQPPGEQAAAAEVGRLGAVEAVERLASPRLAATGRRPRGRPAASARPARSSRMRAGEGVVAAASVRRCCGSLARAGARASRASASAAIGRAGNRSSIGVAAGCGMTTPWCCGGQEAVGPVDRPAGRLPRRVGDDDEGGQVVGLAPQPVGQPAPSAGKPLRRKPLFCLERRRRVVGRLGDHRADHGQLVGDLGEVREQVARPTGRSGRAGGTPSRLPQQADLAEEDVGPLVGLRATCRAAAPARACSRTSRRGSGRRRGRCGWCAALRGSGCWAAAPAADRAIADEQTERGRHPGRALDPGEELATVHAAMNRGAHPSASFIDRRGTRCC